MPFDAAALSAVLGWSYFVAWSLSFYGQVLLNFQRKSTAGLSLDFVYLNVAGFLSYTIYTLSFFASPLARKQYRDKWGSDNLVQPNDVGFALHALAISSVTLVQTLIYPSHPHPLPLAPTAVPSHPGSRGRLSQWSRILLLLASYGAALLVVEMWIGNTLFIDVLYYLSAVKMGVTLVKYVPQALLNVSRRSTVGWSIGNILLDLTGGCLSIAQAVLDSAVSGNWTGITGNPIKFGLGIVSLLFDILFIVQHYVLYPEDKAGVDVEVDEEVATTHERQRLLGPAGTPAAASV
ncbi:hypothetical protein BC831DRAFT_453770 [Entophlyctis helioformis]|nr:hypothetical protein BC831DRAFT_453770 [Entophlyctis helioformis]